MILRDDWLFALGIALIIIGSLVGFRDEANNRRREKAGVYAGR